MRFHFTAADTAPAREALGALTREYGQSAAQDCDTIVVLGGDGTMLETAHKTLKLGKPLYGMNMGSVGFLMNPYDAGGLPERLGETHGFTLYPLRMNAQDRQGRVVEALAFNEVSLLRQSRQAASIKITVDGVERLPELICDGVLAATPAGSTAYNLSAHGPIVPLSADVLALTPISPFRPRHWRGALLPGGARIRFDILQHDKRPVSATADYTEMRDVVRVEIERDTHTGFTLLFNPDHNLEERILKEQFAP